MLELGATEQKVSGKKFLENEVTKKVKNPSDAQIKSVYDANKSQVGSATLEQVKPQIIRYLRDEPEKRAYANLMKTLREKFPVAYHNDVKKTDLIGADAVAVVGSKQITAADFEKKNGLVLYEYKANLFDQVQRNSI